LRRTRIRCCELPSTRLSTPAALDIKIQGVKQKQFSSCQMKCCIWWPRACCTYSDGHNIVAACCTTEGGGVVSRQREGGFLFNTVSRSSVEPFLPTCCPVGIFCLPHASILKNEN
jgi:hypothetical protein